MMSKVDFIAVTTSTVPIPGQTNQYRYQFNLLGRSYTRESFDDDFHDGGSAAVEKLVPVSTAAGVSTPSPRVVRVVMDRALSDKHEPQKSTKQMNLMRRDAECHADIFGVDVSLYLWADQNQLFMEMPELGRNLFDVFVNSQYLDETADQEEDLRTYSKRERLSIALKIAQQIAALHAHEIVHRDLKPGNIMLDDEQHVWVIDNGDSLKLHEEGRRQSTPGYSSAGCWTRYGGGQASPELSDDCFSLGKTLVDVLYGYTGYSIRHDFTYGSIDSDDSDELADREEENRNYRLLKDPTLDLTYDQFIGDRELTDLISGLLHTDPDQRTDIQTVIQTLSSKLKKAAEEEQAALPDNMEGRDEAVAAIQKDIAAADTAVEFHELYTRVAEAKRTRLYVPKGDDVLKAFGIKVLNAMQNKKGGFANLESLVSLQNEFQFCRLQDQIRTTIERLDDAQNSTVISLTELETKLEIAKPSGNLDQLQTLSAKYTEIAESHKHRDWWRVGCLKSKRTQTMKDCTAFFANHIGAQREESVEASIDITS